MTTENNRQTLIRWIVEGTAGKNSVRVTAALDYAAKALERALDTIAEYSTDPDDAAFSIECNKYDLEEIASAFDELTAKYSDCTACEVIGNALKACDKLDSMSFRIRYYE